MSKSTISRPKYTKKLTQNSLNFKKERSKAEITQKKKKNYRRNYMQSVKRMYKIMNTRLIQAYLFDIFLG